MAPANSAFPAGPRRPCVHGRGKPAQMSFYLENRPATHRAHGARSEDSFKFLPLAGFLSLRVQVPRSQFSRASRPRRARLAAGLAAIGRLCFVVGTFCPGRACPPHHCSSARCSVGRRSHASPAASAASANLRALGRRICAFRLLNRHRKASLTAAILPKSCPAAMSSIHKPAAITGAHWRRRTRWTR